MNNKLKMAVLPMIAFSLLLASCKKEKDENGGSESIAGRYKMTGLEKVEAGGNIDQFPLTDDCVKDDVLEFKSNKTYVYTDAGSVCSIDGSQSGTWSQSGNQLTIDGEVVSIVSQTSTQLVLLRTIVLDETMAFKATYQKL